ncbi:MAG: hypothetical protein ABIA63_08940 [bacterium]
MEIDISFQEKNIILRWAQETNKRSGNSRENNVAFPDEESLVSILKMHKGGPIDFTFNRLTVILSWAEDVLDCNFGGGEISSNQEQETLKKIQKAYNLLCEINDLPSSKQLIDVGDELEPFEDIIVAPEPRHIGWWILGISLGFTVLASIAFLIFSLNRKIDQLRGELYRIEFLAGEVYRKRELNWMRVYQSSKLFSGDSLMTGKNSYIILSNRQGSQRLEENRRILLK